MSSNSIRDRDILADDISAYVLPQIRAHGFVDLPKPKEPIPMWNLHRPRNDGGYDVISITFDKKRRPLFDGTINVIGSEGIRQPWGEFVEANQACAYTPLKRVLVQKRRGGILAILLPYWFSHGWFGFLPTDNEEENRTAARRACEEFIACLDQAEGWWATRELGPNLISSELEVTVKNSPPATRR